MTRVMPVAIPPGRGQCPAWPPAPGRTRVCSICTACSVLGVQAEQRQDGRRDLGRLDRSSDAGAVTDAGAGDTTSGHVAVLRVVTAVLGDLALPAGVDDAVLGDADHVRDAGSPAGTPKNVAAAAPA